MRGLLFAIGLLTAPLGALALTWDFDEGTTWGWTAQEAGFYSTRGTADATTVYSEVEDGVWRIAPVPGAQKPTLQLRSPPIGEDSALFDYVTLRLRIIHHTPTAGTLLMRWFNSEYTRLLGLYQHEDEDEDEVVPFSTSRFQLYPTQWEDITIDIRALEANPEIAIVWQDTLFEFHFDLDLHTAAQGPADHPAFVEVDWIQLTGAEELLLGELSPRAIVVEAGVPGALFAEPAFFPLVEGITGKTVGLGQSAGTLGDVDGDGDVDLVAVWNRLTATGSDHGWLIASNDGFGGFAPTQEEAASAYLSLQGSDFDGDGLLDLVFDGERIVELWHNRGEDGFESTLRLSGVEFIGLADGEGDGDVDLLVLELDDESPHVVLWLNDGDAGFVRSDRFDLDSEEELLPYPTSEQVPGEAVHLLWNRPCYLPQGPWQRTRPWATSEEPPLFFETEVNPCTLQLLADVDGDGEVDLLSVSVIREFFFTATTYHGLDLWRLDASGGVSRHPLLGSQVQVSHRAIAHDLNGDGLLDLALVDGNLATGPALVVLVGQRDGLPVVEGRYRLPGTGGQVLPGDVNGDGAADLVVLGRSVAGGPGGAFVFLNQHTPATAIAAETTTTPSAFVLGANYPNPFNPATTIPLALPADASEVALTIYNVLGQPVRRVWAGSLAAGAHRLAWDGRDAQGQPVAAGVYWYRLQVDDQTHTRKMIKIE